MILDEHFRCLGTFDYAYVAKANPFALLTPLHIQNFALLAVNAIPEILNCSRLGIVVRKYIAS
jgi:hypothetical protein